MGRTSSTILPAQTRARLCPQLGQAPLPIHEKGTIRFSPHLGHRSLRNPKCRSPQRRNLSSTARTRGWRGPNVSRNRSSQTRRRSSRWTSTMSLSGLEGLRGREPRPEVAPHHARADRRAENLTDRLLHVLDPFRFGEARARAGAALPLGDREGEAPALAEDVNVLGHASLLRWPPRPRLR